ncbi:DUF4340 domain-containing protein [Roseiconus nitratireducens]|uniref:DUF4340 domain-containing protein n=1 Tax=Roseiconus nitratireducens TaxID=2605748 RepID=A0A5M6DDU2_9BACT|nr:DUF4340 domain-containing protein [Roseiconus nitratireducens]KAA5545563.1 DUF4340 domain-containing protein [Roseiconus nitratireducens]
MNETKKTGIFWAIAAATLLIAAIVAWPSSTQDETSLVDGLVGTKLFAEFKDPLAAADLKVVTFDDAQGELRNFEVRKDSENGLWTIPSKGGYPADAVEQMRDAANSLVDLKVLDVPTDNPEDHPGMGVVEPKLEDLDVGDEGVGRLVTFKDAEQQVLASLIIGAPVKGQEGQLYVRKPGQDPVYVVSLDDSPLTTKFNDWIEQDLLQLSSIDVNDLEVKDYNASLGLQGVALTRNYSAEFSKDGTEWKLVSLKEYDKENPLADPTEVSIDPDQKLNTQKLSDLTNALDDLKFVDVLRKPDGISANLRADKDFASDQEAAAQLATRGFIPVPMGPNGEIEILSANGELTATTQEGVQYILRFGNISGIAEDGEEETDTADESDSAGGVNRYLMVSTTVDESFFPAPELEPIPQTLEDLDAMDRKEQEAEAAAQAATQESASEEPATGEGQPMQDQPGEDGPEADSEPASDSEPAADESADDDAESSTEADSKDPAEDNADAPDENAAEAGDEESSKASSADADAESSEPENEAVSEVEGETDASGSGESTGSGQGQAADEASDEAAESDAAQSDDESDAAESDAQADAGPSSESSDKPADSQPSEQESPASEPAESDSAEKPADDAKAAPVAETKEEKLERLAGVQEKITKANERKLEQREENLQQARRRSQELNERFADWYYVIPEDTYTKLRIQRDELFDSGDSDASNPAARMPNMPNLGFPPGGFPQGN